MWIGAISAIILVFFVIFSILWERFRRKQALILKEEKERQALIIKWHKKEQTQELATLEKRHSQKENTLKKALKSAEIKHAKALANLEEMKKAHEVKKKNLSKYHKKKQDVRREKRSIEEQVKEILGRDDKWNDHSLSGPKSKKIGKPKGANGGGRKRPETFHTSIEFYPQQCKNCGCSLEKASHFRSHDSVITELFHEWDEFKEYKLIRLKNIKRIIYRARCPECKTLTSADLGLFKKARFGPSFISYVIGERIDTALPYNAIIKDMVKMFGPRFIVTPAAIVDWFKKFEKQIGNIYEQLKEMLENQVFAHIDETGLSLRGDNWWLWIICCANLVIYRESSSRGHDAIEDIIKGFEGTIIADFFSAYEKFTDNSHQKCLAHLLGDIIEHVVKLKKQNDKIKKKLKEHKEALLEEKRTQLRNEGVPVSLRNSLTKKCLL